MSIKLTQQTKTSAKSTRTKGQDGAANIEQWEQVAPKVSLAGIVARFTDDETGEVYETTLRPSQVLNTKGQPITTEKSGGLWFGQGVQVDTPHGLVKFQLSGNLTITNAKHAMQAQAEADALAELSDDERE